MFGLFLMYLFRNLAVAIVAAFALVWIAGYVGGSFEAYYFSPISESIKVLSPVYHINRTLVENSAIGQSNYTGGCIAYLLIVSMICFIAGLGISKIRKVDVA
jgi:ABC-2 type transport system permease protein